MDFKPSSWSNVTIMKDLITIFGCKCGKCNVSTYPGRIYFSHEWDCKKKCWIKLEYSEQENRFISLLELEKLKKEFPIQKKSLFISNTPQDTKTKSYRKRYFN